MRVTIVMPEQLYCTFCKGFNFRCFALTRNGVDGSLPPVNSAFSASSAGKKKTSGRIDDTTFAEIQSMELNLSSTNWRERCNGVEQLQQLAESNPTALSSCLTKVTVSFNLVYLFSIYLFYLSIIYFFTYSFVYYLFIN